MLGCFIGTNLYCSHNINQVERVWGRMLMWPRRRGHPTRMSQSWGTLGGTDLVIAEATTITTAAAAITTVSEVMNQRTNLRAASWHSQDISMISPVGGILTNLSRQQDKSSFTLVGHLPSTPESLHRPLMTYIWKTPSTLGDGKMEAWCQGALNKDKWLHCLPCRIIQCCHEPVHRGTTGQVEVPSRIWGG